jgi:hypothetical protein
MCWVGTWLLWPQSQQNGLYMPATAIMVTLSLLCINQQLPQLQWSQLTLYCGSAGLKAVAAAASAASAVLVIQLSDSGACTGTKLSVYGTAVCASCRQSGYCCSELPCTLLSTPAGRQQATGVILCRQSMIDVLSRRYCGQHSPNSFAFVSISSSRGCCFGLTKPSVEQYKVTRHSRICYRRPATYRTRGPSFMACSWACLTRGGASSMRVKHCQAGTA